MKIEKALIAAAFSLVVACATPAQSLPRNSYLDALVKSTAQLVHQVETDPAVMDRYCRHFAMNRQEVVAYLSGLHLSKLPAAGVYMVYGVPHSSGDFHAHLKRLD